MKQDAGTACPCGRTDGKRRPLTLAQCCGPLLQGRPAPDAQALMRSRYTAYALGDEAYLLGTWHPQTRPPSIDIDPALRWIGLEVREARETAADRAEVAFVARFRREGRGGRLQERSRFSREPDGRWYYVDGDVR